MQSVVDFLDTSQRRRIRVVQEGEQAEQSDRAVGRVTELGRSPQSLLVEHHHDFSRRTGRIVEINAPELGKYFDGILDQAAPRILVATTKVEEKRGEVRRVFVELLTCSPRES